MKIILLFFVLAFMHESFARFCRDDIGVPPKSSESCGVPKGGLITQQVTKPIDESSGMFWSEESEKLYFVDKYDPAICWYNTQNGDANCFKIKEGKTISSIHPVTKSKGKLFVVAIDESLYYLNTTGGEDNLKYSVTFIKNIVTDSKTKLRKGKTDKRGRLWYTTANEFSGSLCKIEKGKNTVVMDSRFLSPGGIGWSQDNKLLYVVDRQTGKIYEYDYKDDQGTIENRREVFYISDNLPNISGGPTDIVVDKKGYLWIGIMQSGQLISYDPKEKKIHHQISMPVRGIVGLECGTKKSKNLYVSTTTHFSCDRNTEPDAGSIYVMSGFENELTEENDIDM